MKHSEIEQAFATRTYEKVQEMHKQTQGHTFNVGCSACVAHAKRTLLNYAKKQEENRQHTPNQSIQARKRDASNVGRVQTKPNKRK